MFEIGAKYQFTSEDGDDRLYTYARVIEWQHPLVHIETDDGKRQILNLSNPNFSGAKKWGAGGQPGLVVLQGLFGWGGWEWSMSQ